MNHESTPNQPEQKNSLSSAEAKRHHERLNENLERNAEYSRDEKSAEREARHEVHEKALSASEVASTASEKHQQPAPQGKTKQEKKRSFETTMHHVRKEMSLPERQLSKIIHQPIIEKSSEVIGATVARPSGIIGATIAVSIGLLFLFGVAKYAGFELSGSEMPLLLVLGMISGLLIEWVYKSIRSIFASK